MTHRTPSETRSLRSTPSHLALCAVWALVALNALSCGQKQSTRPPLLNVGDPCKTDDQCSTTLCQALPGLPAVCRRLCASGCQSDEQCEPLGTQPNPRFTCVPATTALCQACRTSSDCPYPADSCYQLGSATVCGQDCSYGAPCPTGYTCGDRTALGSTIPRKQCVPVSGTCDCIPTSAGQKRGCQVQNQYGTCSGQSTCDPADGGWDPCTARTPAPEVCDGIDNDCNGLTDSQDPGLAIPPCEKQQGVCAGARKDAGLCVPGPADGGVDAGGAHWLACGPAQYGVDYQNPETSCDGKDNDCNGLVDDGLAVGNVSQCGSATTQCGVANGVPACSNQCKCTVASCTAPFADCDTLYPNGCESNLHTDPNHCGDCTTKCSFPNANASCVDGGCQAGSCLAGWWNIDGTGCNYQCTFVSNIDIPDLGFIDANCDGIDGDARRAIFVDGTGGNDSNAGTMTLPKQTIGAGIAAASAATPQRDVYISAGTYNETLQMAEGVSLYGGYNAATKWSRAVANVTTVLSAQPIAVSSLNRIRPAELQLLHIQSANATGAGQSSVGVLVVNASGGLTVRGCYVTAGSGTPGVDGVNGSNGAAGGGGNNAAGTGAGTGGPSPCGAFGGGGGAGVGDTNSGLLGSAGWQAPGGGAGAPGGQAGAAGSCSGTSSSDGFAAPSLTSSGGPGAAGLNGYAGSNIGTVDAAGNYLPPAGGNGNAGGAGGGGGGGGSGGGTAHGTNIICTNCSALNSGAGGGGGGGGCGGTSGSGGEGGGSSFAIVTVNSQVTVDTTRMFTSSGGNGGNGGSGGTGGAGGAAGGGAPGQSSNNSCSNRSGGRGADGSAGGNGGNGGGASGGTGGASVCILFKGNTPNSNNVQCSNGSPGRGGNGGTNGAQPAPNGTQGISGAQQAAL